MPARKRAFTYLAVALGVLAAGMLVTAAAAVADVKDYGDAPDAQPAGYITAHGVTGHFPSLEASNGARHTAPGALRLGVGVDTEPDSKQVNADAYDDGLSVNFATVCRTTTVTFLVDASGLPASSRAAGHTAYLNAWFDWTRDGDWEDTDRCAPEWAVQNYPVDMASFAAEPVQAIQVTVTAGAQVQEHWSRASVTLDEPFVSPAGRGQFTNGETEDYLTRALRGRFLNVRCKPQSAFAVHGKKVRVRFVVKKKAPGPLRVRLRNRGLPKGIRVAFGPGGFTVRSTKDPPKRFQSFTLRFRFDDAKGATSLVKCFVLIFHGKPKVLGAPPQPPPEPPIGDCPKGFIRTGDSGNLTVTVSGNNCGRTIGSLWFPLSQFTTGFDRVGINEVSNPLTQDQRRWSCALKSAYGGLPDVVCTSDPPVPRDSFFDVFIGLDVSPRPQLGGQLSGFTGEGATPDAGFNIAPS